MRCATRACKPWNITTAHSTARSISRAIASFSRPVASLALWIMYPFASLVSPRAPSDFMRTHWCRFHALSIFESTMMSNVLRLALLIQAVNGQNEVDAQRKVNSRADVVDMGSDETHNSDKNKIEIVGENPSNPQAVIMMSSPLWPDRRRMTVELFPDEAPVIVSNFIDLANQQFYDGLHFDRVFKGKSAHTGCPNSRDPGPPMPKEAGTGSAPPNTEFKNYKTGEMVKRGADGSFPMDAGVRDNAKNTVAWDGGGSRFLFNAADNDKFNGKHPVFGNTIENAAFISAISKVLRSGPRPDAPKDPIKLVSVTIVDPAGGCRRRRLDTMAITSEESWFEAWQDSIGCWWMGLPMPTQTQLGACVGAFGLHLGSRFDSALGRAAGASRQGVQASPDCKWVSERATQLQMPEFPDFGGLKFSVPPLPRLLPRWQQNPWQQSMGVISNQYAQVGPTHTTTQSQVGPTYQTTDKTTLSQVGPTQGPIQTEESAWAPVAVGAGAGFASAALVVGFAGFFMFRKPRAEPVSPVSPGMAMSAKSSSMAWSS